MARQWVIHAKIGTHSSLALRLWFDKDCNANIGDKILAIEETLYQGLHSRWKNIKNNGNWKWYRITDLEPIVFVTELGTYRPVKK